MAVFSLQGIVASRIPIQIVQGGIAVVVAIAQSRPKTLRKTIGQGRRREHSHRLSIHNIVACSHREIGILEWVAFHGGIDRNDVALLCLLIVVGVDALVIPLQLAFQLPFGKDLMLNISNLMQNQGIVNGIDGGNIHFGMTQRMGPEEIVLVLNKRRRLQLQLTPFPKEPIGQKVSRKVVFGPLFGILVEHIGHDLRQVAVVPLVPRSEGQDAVPQHHANLRHKAVVHKLSILLPHPPQAVGKQQTAVVIQEVVVGRVAVGLDTKGNLLAAIARGDKASPSVEATIGLLEVKDKTLAESGLVVDIDRATEPTAVVGGTTPPLQVDVIDQKHGNGTEIDLSQRRGVELKPIPKHEGMAGRGTPERRRGDASRTVGLDKHRAMLDQQFRERRGALGLEHQRVHLFHHQRGQRLVLDTVGRNVDSIKGDGVLSADAKRQQDKTKKNNRPVSHCCSFVSDSGLTSSNTLTLPISLPFS